jgi:lipid-binding SYLF domain-containing protein
MQRLTSLVIALFALVLGSATAQADARTDQRLDDSRQIFESFTFLTEQSIPGWLLERAYGIVVVPRVIRSAWHRRARPGRDIRAQPDGTWSYPVGDPRANIGLQWGVQSTDLVPLMSPQRRGTRVKVRAGVMPARGTV